MRVANLQLRKKVFGEIEPAESYFERSEKRRAASRSTYERSELVTPGSFPASTTYKNHPQPGGFCYNNNHDQS